MFKSSVIKPPLIAFCVCLAAACVWGYLLWYKYSHFGYYDWDLAFFTQACWNLLHGSQYVSLVGINYFGDHSYFITFLYLPFFALVPHPLTLVFLKVAAYAVSAFLLFRIFSRESGLAIAFALMLGYLILPASIFTLLYDFNPESLSMPFIVLMFDGFARKKWRMFWISTACLLLIKENFALVTAAFAVYGWFTAKDMEQKKHARWLFILSLILFYVLTKWVVPHFRHLSTHAFVVRYAYLGSSLEEIAQNILFHPGKILAILLDASNADFIRHLFGPWLFPSLLGLPVLGVASPLFVQHMLSASAQEHSIYYHYGMTFAPFIFLSVHQGVCMLRRMVQPHVVQWAICILLVPALFLLARYSDDVWQHIDYHQDGESAAREELLALVPPQEPVVATFDFLTPLSMRQEVYSFHKVYDDYYQDPKKISQSELNVRARFVLPEAVTYALIDFNDQWLAGCFARAPQATKQRVDDFLKEWHVVKRYGQMYLYRRNTAITTGT